MAQKNTNFLIIHGSLGSPQGNWFPWIKKELEKEGHTVEVPAFPTPDNQSFASWLAVAEQSLKNFDPSQTVLIGHSSGAIFVFRLAELTKKPYKAIFSVCPFMKDLGLDTYDRLNFSFVHHAFDWAKIKRNVSHIHCFAGDNDPYVPLSCAQEVAHLSGASLEIVREGGHLNAETGYLDFPLLLTKIRQTV
jgi:uncharacterized protein